MSQACQKLGLPAQYIKKCPPELQDANFNWWNRSEEIGRQFSRADKERDEAWLVRCKGGMARGILSSRYAKLDNRQLLEALFPLFKGGLGNRFGVGLVNLSPESLSSAV